MTLHGSQHDPHVPSCDACGLQALLVAASQYIHAFTQVATSATAQGMQAAGIQVAACTAVSMYYCRCTCNIKCLTSAHLYFVLCCCHNSFQTLSCQRDHMPLLSCPRVCSKAPACLGLLMWWDKAQTQPGSITLVIANTCTCIHQQLVT